MRTEDKPMHEIQDLQEETQTDDSLVTPLPSKPHETVCSLKVKNEPYAVECESYTELHDSDPPESLRKSQDVQAAWNHESHYATSEIKVVNDPRPARKKEEAERKAFLRKKEESHRKHRKWLIADANARIARAKGAQLQKSL